MRPDVVLPSVALTLASLCTIGAVPVLPKGPESSSLLDALPGHGHHYTDFSAMRGHVFLADQKLAGHLISPPPHFGAMRPGDPQLRTEVHLGRTRKLLVMDSQGNNQRGLVFGGGSGPEKVWSFGAAKSPAAHWNPNRDPSLPSSSSAP